MVANRGMVVNYMHKFNADGVIQTCAKSTYDIVYTFTDLKMECNWAGMSVKRKGKLTREAIG